jgi:hypothetical protein
MGNRLVDEFVALRLPQHTEEVMRIFSRKGACSRFKALLDSKGLLESGISTKTRTAQLH